MSTIDTRWLEGNEEEPFETEMRICDPHHHHWDRADGRYMREDLLDDVRGHNVETTVFVECGSQYRSDGPEHLRPVGETAFVEEIANQRIGSEDTGGLVAGIVGHANLLLGAEVSEVLEAHLATSPSRFRGIRHSAAWHESPAIRQSHSAPPPHMLTLAAFGEGLRQLQQFDLSFDAWLFHTQIDELADLAHNHPDTRIILNHMGGPLGIGPFENKRAEVFEAWRRSVSRLAECENVVVKLGGLQMALCGFGWHHRKKPPTSEELAEMGQPYYLYCIERFGADRCMFESNFPVDKVSCSYNVLWNCFKRLTRSFSSDERNALFRDTAERVYRIG